MEPSRGLRRVPPVTVWEVPGITAKRLKKGPLPTPIRLVL